MEEDLTDENSSAIAAKTFLLRHITGAEICTY